MQTQTQTKERVTGVGLNKIAIVVLADIETHEDLARVTNAMMTAREFKEAGDEVQLIFDGAGTRWPGELTRPDHKSHADPLVQFVAHAGFFGVPLGLYLAWALRRGTPPAT